MGLLIFHIESIYNVSGFYTNWFPRYSRHLIFTKRGITLSIFEALRLKVISTSSYGMDTVYQNQLHILNGSSDIVSTRKCNV